jgi:hypothetical protein
LPAKYAGSGKEMEVILMIMSLYTAQQHLTPEKREQGRRGRLFLLQGVV